jgi:hypothetical protein
MSWYLTIRSDEAYSQHADTSDVIRLLASMHELRQTGPADFEAAPAMPWVSVVIAMADANGNYAVGSTLPPSINVVELICSDFDDASWYESIARRIATALNWQATENHENRRIWPPNETHA